MSKLLRADRVLTVKFTVQNLSMCSEPPFPGLSPTTAYSPLIPTSEQLCGSPLLTTFPQSSNELIFFTFFKVTPSEPPF